MCGIVGYVGHRDAFPLITEGLTRLEYRGYDSAGVAVLQNDTLIVRRAIGRVQNLLSTNGSQTPAGNIGIGHTRWATHGKPLVRNAHPHVDCTGSIAVVHNGIIENYKALRQSLAFRGHVFRSETDTEVIAHLIEEQVGGDLKDRVRMVMELLRGEYALAILSESDPNVLVAVRSGNPPLLVGLGEAEHFLSSDPLSLTPYTRTIWPLEEGELAIVAGDRVEIMSAGGARPIHRNSVGIGWSPGEAELGSHSHFMHKEIHEQPSAIYRTFRDRALLEMGDVGLEGLSLSRRQWRDVRRMALVGCGTSSHAALIGRWFFENLARIPVNVDIGSEFRYRDALLGQEDVCVFISQSGETADTLGALRMAKANGVRVLGVCNVSGSSLTREADGVLLTCTGPEIGVASTKAFTAQIVALFLMALQAGRAREVVAIDQARSLLKELTELPAQMGELLQQEEERIAALAAMFHWCRNFFFLGRSLYYPVALEGALKLKEIAYVRAEAFPAGEMKHGPLALVDRTTTTVVIVPAGKTHSKMLSTIEEVKAREGHIIALCTKGDEATLPLADQTLLLPSTCEYLMPCLLAIPLQLFAYHMAVLSGCDVDRPRNLAKSVTVE